jgi:hypothetical protein
MRLAWLMIPFLLSAVTGCGNGASITVVSDFRTDQDDPGVRVVVTTATESDRERGAGPHRREAGDP